MRKQYNLEQINGGFFTCRVTIEDSLKIPDNRDFPRGPVVKTRPSNAGGVGSIPGQGTKIPHDVGCDQKLKKIS